MTLHKLWRAIFPASALLFLLIISLTTDARADELPRGTLIEALRLAVEKGLSDPTIIESQKDFDALRSEREFKAIVTGLKRIRPAN